MSNQKLKQKLVSFSSNKEKLDEISREIENGWYFINLVRNGNCYIGIMELNSDKNIEQESVFIPARKKIKISK